jgi:hypothetical protein
LHGGDESLLDDDKVRGILIPGLSVEVQSHFGIAPHTVEWIVSQEKVGDRYLHADACPVQIARLDGGANAYLIEVKRSRDRLRPDGDRAQPDVDSPSSRDEAVLVDQVAREFGEAIALTVAVKNGSKELGPIGVGEGGIPARPVLHAKRHHTTGREAAQTKVGQQSGG